MTGYNDPYELPEAYLHSLSAKQTARRLKRSRKSIASHRHDLLVAMRVINTLDKEMLQAEWENWLFDENERCEELVELTTLDTDSEASTRAENISSGRGKNLEEWSITYCKSCAADKEYVMRAHEKKGLL